MLEYFVYNEDVNRQEIIKYNIFKNYKFCNGLYTVVKQYNKNKDIDLFKKEINNQLLYCFWGRCEYEVVITSWPPHVDVEEIDRIKNEIDKHNSKYSWKQVRTSVNLSVAEKISIYDQIMLNFDIFFNYILSNLKEIESLNKKDN